MTLTENEGRRPLIKKHLTKNIKNFTSFWFIRVPCNLFREKIVHLFHLCCNIFQGDFFASTASYEVFCKSDDNARRSLQYQPSLIRGQLIYTLGWVRKNIDLRHIISLCVAKLAYKPIPYPKYSVFYTRDHKSQAIHTKLASILG